MQDATTLESMIGSPKLNLESCDDNAQQRASVVTPVYGALNDNIFIRRDRELQ